MAAARRGERAQQALMRLFGAAQRGVYRASGGRLGASAPGGIPVLLLTTTGRKSGRARTWPLGYLRDGEALVVIASAGGGPRHPAWYHNLRAHPEVTVQLGREVRRMRAAVAQGAERDRLWALVTARYPVYARYEGATARQIPVVVLRPLP